MQTGLHAAKPPDPGRGWPVTETQMNELLTLNVFAQSLPAAVIGMLLFGGIVVLPWLVYREPHGEPASPQTVPAPPVPVAATFRPVKAAPARAVVATASVRREHGPRERRWQPRAAGQPAGSAASTCICANT